MREDERPTRYDALLVVGFGGPEGPDDVMPFLENVTRGRGVPRERLEVVAEHYLARDGVSPINAQNRSLIYALEAELRRAGHRLPIYFGNRNWHPFLADTVRAMRDDGVGRALAFVTSVFSSYSGCRQYREDIEAARAEVGAGAPVIDKLRGFHNHPGFVEPMAEHVAAALATLPVDDDPRVAFTAHSIPASMAATSDYRTQLLDACELIADRVPGRPGWDLVYQSRSGPPQVPWLEPDIGDHLRALAERGVGAVAVAPIGFISDHMEVIQDLDTDAAQVAAEAGLVMVRVSTVGTHPRFVAGIRELVEERLDPARPRLALGNLGPRPDTCPADCCPAPRRL